MPSVGITTNFGLSMGTSLSLISDNGFLFNSTVLVMQDDKEQGVSKHE